MVCADSDHARRPYVFLEVLDQDIEMVPDVREHIAQSFLSCHLSALFMLPFLLDPSRALAGVRRRPLHLAVLFGRHLGKPLHEGDQVPDFVILVHGSVRSHGWFVVRRPRGGDRPFPSPSNR